MATQTNTETEFSTLAEALLAVQTELPTAIHKDAENPHYRSKYVTLDALLEVVRPALNKRGVLLMQWPERADDGTLVLTTRLTYITGESHETSMVLLPPKDDPQGQGSAITYARRYSLMAILGLAADDDDDGNAGSRGNVNRGRRESEPQGPRKLTRDEVARIEKAVIDAGMIDAFGHKLRSFGLKSAADMTTDQALALRAWLDDRPTPKAQAS